LYLDWTKHLKNEEEKTRFESSVMGAKQVLDRQKDLLDEYERSLDRSEVDIRTYDTPNWAEKQAHKNGYRSCLAKIKELIDLDQQVKGNK
jgi:hypothetical protein